MDFPCWTAPAVLGQAQNRSSGFRGGGASKPRILTHRVPKPNTQHKACEDNIPFDSFGNTQEDFGATEHLLPGATGCVKNSGWPERRRSCGSCPLPAALLPRRAFKL